MERQTDSGLIVHDDRYDHYDDPAEDDGDIDGELTDNPVESYDPLAALNMQNKERMAILARDYNAFIDPGMLVSASVNILADMVLNEEGMREWKLRQETLVSHVLDQMEKDVPDQRARETLTQGVPNGGLNRAQRRALAKARR